jgi:hypothetical protein
VIEKLELPRVGSAKSPVGWSHIVGDHSVSITGCDLEREGLIIQVGVTLPVLAPVPGHCLPIAFGPFYGNRDYITSSAHICYQHQIKVGVPINRESDTTTLSASNPACIYLRTSS